jgi:predicted  nucleic acid-binding Zn-ribbon protein
MTPIEDDIQLLIEIVKKDIDIQEKRRFLDGAPEQIKILDKKIKQMDEELAESQKAMDKLEEERRHLEREISSQNDKIKQKRIESDNINSNVAYKALNKEIEYLEKLVYKEEERVLQILEQAESKKKEVATIQDKINKEKGALLDERTGLEERMVREEEQLKIIEDEKVRILPHLSNRINELYMRILKVKGDSGVANLVGDICQGCYSRVPPQKAHEVRKNNQILTCEVCGRILVYYPID